MGKVKCVIRQGWTNRDADGNLLERKDYIYVTNEDGTPTIYDSIKEARAEIRANYGRDANKNGILHTRSVDDYTGNVHDGYVYIVREDSDEYAEIIEQTEQAITEAVAAYDLAIEAASVADALASRAINSNAEEAAKAAENARHYAGSARQWAAMSEYWAGQTRASEAHSAAESAAEVADYASRRAADAAESAAEAAANEAYCASIIKANAAALALLDAYEDATGRQPYDMDAAAVMRVARDEITGTGLRSNDLNRATVDAMVEAIAAKATEGAERAAVEAAATPEAYAEAMGSCEDATNLLAYGAYEAMHAGTHPETADEVRELDRLMGYAAEIVQRDGAAHGIQWEEYRACAEDIREVWEGPDYYRIAYSDGPTYGEVRYYETTRDLARDLASAYQSATETHLPYAERAERHERPIYQPYELEAFLGEPDAYDVDAIEAETTEYDPRTGARVWAAFGDDLAAIAARHERRA